MPEGFSFDNSLGCVGLMGHNLSLLLYYLLPKV